MNILQHFILAFFTTFVNESERNWLEIAITSWKTLLFFYTCTNNEKQNF